MAHSRVPLLSLLIILYSPLAFAAPWIVTKYIERTTITIQDLPDAEPYTQTEVVTLTVEDPDVVSTQTTIDSYFDLTAINVFIEPSQGVEVTDSIGGAAMHYLVQHTHTWPESCSPSTGIYTTQNAVEVPPDVRGVITPTSTSTSIYQIQTDDPTTTLLYGYLDPSDVPSELMSVYENSIPGEILLCSSDTSCYNLTHTVGGNAISGSYCCDSECHHTWGLLYWHVGIIVLFSWIGFWLLVGVIWNIIGFRNLMLGKSAPRGVPKAWACLLPVLSCLLICAMGAGYEAKPAEDRKELRKQWDGLSFWKKSKMWLRWGFSRGYPPMLGTPPGKKFPRKGPPKPPSTATTVPAGAGADTETGVKNRTESQQDPPPAYVTDQQQRISE
ncbi:hypothetical protein FQN54_009052 [Arachnomyces sp. PD_36]|nr:hypothetical protein FQN54_009052 [Arachnomyces sp. PD_36]